jgi:hypothetical protein
MDKVANGAFQLGSTGVPFNNILDGLSNTILAGEKNVPLGGWGVGGLDSSLYNGDCPSASTRAGGGGVGLSESLNDPGWKFGSYHPQICQFAFCDGSVRPLPTSIPPDVLQLLLDRRDGQVIPASY